MTFAWSQWEWRLFCRAAVVALAAFALAWLVTAVTDEGGISWGERAGRALPLTPACGMVGVWAALAPAIGRGELRAWEALGRAPAWSGAPAVLGAVAMSLAAAAAIGGLRSVDVRGFYPTAARASVWTWEGGHFVDHVRGIRVAADATPTREPPQASAVLAAIPPRGRQAAALATAAAGTALPLLLASAMLGRGRRSGPTRSRETSWVLTGPLAAALDGLTASSAVALSLFLFQAAAARRSPALLGVWPPTLLLAFAARRYGALS